ncbi:SPOR domain-containing protein [Trinickia sp. LjRoot230]|uniref:SPOR domain-containing protein n=1 Tax=Trinickia sp. LjRoot230 TaxID=3342288 RepID=UPI003ECF8EAE
MGLFSFGNKDDAPRRRGANARSARVERSRRRTERTGDADAMLLDPTLPEKQRARRRLVGAIALVVAAIVILPMVLDSHPKPVTDDIAIDIPSRPANLPSHTNSDGAEPAAAVAPDSASGAAATAAATGVAPTTPAPAPAPAEQATKPKQAKPANSTQQAHTSAATKAPVSPVESRAQNAKQAATPAPQGAGEDDTSASSPSAPAGARFAVQLGAFADDANARRWEGKLKAAGVPAYVEHRKQADGSTRSLLRAGPFADRAAASAAIAKVRDAGLTANAAQ